MDAGLGEIFPELIKHLGTQVDSGSLQFLIAY